MYEFYMMDIKLPITPSKLQVKISNKNKTVTLINEGEMNLLKTPGLTEISFEVLLPAMEGYPFADYGDQKFQGIDYYLGLFEDLKVEKKSFLFKVIRGLELYDTDKIVTLEDYSIVEEAGNGFDVKVSINLKEYREYKTELIKPDKPKKNPNKNNKKRPAKSIPKSYKVVKGDNLWNICKKHLGKGSKCWDIAKLNKIKNPNLIFPGQVIRFE